MEICRYVEVKSSSPSLPYIPLSFTSLSANLPSILYFPLPCVTIPYLPYLPLTFPFYSLPCPFRSSLYSSFPLNLPHSVSSFPFPSKSSPFLSQPSPSLLFHFQYLYLFLPISFPTYLLPYLSTSLPSPSLSNPISHHSLFLAITLPLFLSFTPFFFPLCLPFFSSLPLLGLSFLSPPREGGRISYSPVFNSFKMFLN